MSQLSQSIKEQIGYVESEWSEGETRRFKCNFCGHPYADEDGGAVGSHGPYPARCFESIKGRRCPGKIVEVKE